MSEAYHVPKDRWELTPIILEKNPLTGHYEGEDGPDKSTGNPGFRGMKTLLKNPEPLVEASGVGSRSVFDGYNEYGDDRDESTALPGGLRGHVQVVRESTARGLDLAAEITDEVYDGERKIVLLDGLESYKRQQAGFTRVFKGLIKEGGLNEDTIFIQQLYTLGKKANGTYCYVSADGQSKQYRSFRKKLAQNQFVMQAVESLAREEIGPKFTQEDVEEIIFKIITISTNSNIGIAKNRNIPLNYENNAHAGGAAADIMLTDANGRLLSLTPYCHIGAEAAMDYMEDDENFDKFKARMMTDKKLRDHMGKIGFTTESFTFEAWKILRNVRRFRFHMMKALGATFYSADPPEDGGEDWHWELGNILYKPNGDVVWSAKTAKKYPNSGNPGHTLQKIGPKGVAVYGGRSAHQLAAKNFGLEL